jgi:hypothetical protein
VYPTLTGRELVDSKCGNATLGNVASVGIADAIDGSEVPVSVAVVHASVTRIQATFGAAKLTCADASMEPKIGAAQWIEPGSLREIAAFGDAHNAAILVMSSISLGPGGTMARSCLYLVDDNGRIKEERDAVLRRAGRRRSDLVIVKQLPPACGLEYTARATGHDPAASPTATQTRLRGSL